MPHVVIENPVLNSPFEAPRRHFRFAEDGITDEVVEARRISQCFIPIARPRRPGANRSAFETEWTLDRIRPNEFVNRIRDRVAGWRESGHPGLTGTSAQLLAYWTRPDRERRLFFCQIEALETAIYLAEVAGKSGDAWIENELRRANAEAHGRPPRSAALRGPWQGPPLRRVAFKMATGSGKTVVMAMLIAWQALNKIADPQDARFSDAFLVVTPGITIRDRLRVLLPNDPGNYYRALDLVPADRWAELGKVKLVITNFHAFIPRERVAAGRLARAMLRQGDANPLAETPDQMVRRACRELGSKRNVVVLNDEAHHCYRPRSGGVAGERPKGEERRQVERRERQARVWIGGLEAVQAKIGVRVVYDLSATPYFLRGSGYPEGTLFPWVVSDFSLMDAIESGIVKVPRVPVPDPTAGDEAPTYRDLWPRIRDQLPKKGRGPAAGLPAALRGALHSLYSNYEKCFAQWERNAEAGARGATPPVFVVVCNNTDTSRRVFDYIAGWETTLPDGTVRRVPGRLPLFSNVVGESWTARPNTVLVDSEQLESGEAMSAEFKRIAAREIEEFKAEARARFPGRDAKGLTDEDLLREVMNTVGKAGKLGEGVRCVVSVSMLTEGWDTATVTHILGVRAFGTQLLCEQVVGRGLRRIGYAADAAGRFAPEYAEVYGVPFSFLPVSGSQPEPKVGPSPTRVRALDERAACEITFPRLTGYRHEFPAERLEANFDRRSRMTLTARQRTAAGRGAAARRGRLEDFQRRLAEVDFALAAALLEKHFADRRWLFPDLLRLARQWRVECLALEDGAFPQLLLDGELKHAAADLIRRGITETQTGEPRLRPILRANDPRGSTRVVDFDTLRPTHPTDPRKCHVSHVVVDGDWEVELVRALEAMDAVIGYARNRGLGFTVPYTSNGEAHGYLPDYIVRLDDGRGREDALNLILHLGAAKGEDAAKVAAARTLWLPAVNGDGRFGRWALLEIAEPGDAGNKRSS